MVETLINNWLLKISLMHFSNPLAQKDKPYPSPKKEEEDNQY